MSLGSGEGWQTEERDEGSGRPKNSCRQDGRSEGVRELKVSGRIAPMGWR